jgi:hypothetical protein
MLRHLAPGCTGGVAAGYRRSLGHAATSRASRGLRAAGRLANFLQCFFAQDVGIAFTGFGTLDDLRDDGLFDVIVAVFSLQGVAD